MKHYQEKYHDVAFLTPIPDRRNGIQEFMPFSKVKEVMGRNFYWARIDKRPYLTREEAGILLEELRDVLS